MADRLAFITQPARFIARSGRARNSRYALPSWGDVIGEVNIGCPYYPHLLTDGGNFSYDSTSGIKNALRCEIKQAGKIRGAVDLMGSLTNPVCAVTSPIRLL